jgi:hypothetical protein
MLLRRTAVAAVLVAAPLAFAAPAMAQPPVDIDCAPCVGDINGDGSNDPVWNELTSFGPWETIFDSTDGVLGNDQGAWEGAFDATDGVPGDGQGAWEKAFPPAE